MFRSSRMSKPTDDEALLHQPLPCKTRILVIFTPPFYRKQPVGKPIGAFLIGGMAKNVYIVINLRLSHPM